MRDMRVPALHALRLPNEHPRCERTVSPILGKRQVGPTFPWRSGESSQAKAAHMQLGEFTRKAKRSLALPNSGKLIYDATPVSSAPRHLVSFFALRKMRLLCNSVLANFGVKDRHTSRASACAD
jgi:hypothetical protein